MTETPTDRKLSEREARALEDVRRNHGTRWEPESGIEASRLWDALERKGVIEFNPWAQRWLPKEDGNAKEPF